MSRGVRTLALGLMLGVAVPRAWGQAEPAPVPADLEEGLAQSLYDRGTELYKERRYAEALTLFREAVTTSPQGPAAAAARQMIERTEVKVRGGGGASDLRGTVDEDDDVYGAGEEGPMDPYPEAGADNDRLIVGPGETARAPDQGPGRAGRQAQRNLTIFGGLFGFWQGVSLANVADAGDVGALLALGGAAAGVGGTWLAVRDRQISAGQANAIMAGGTWGSLEGLFLAWALNDLADTPPETDNGYWAGMLVGGLAGVGAGIGYAFTDPSVGDVSVVNSTTAYGTLGGFLVGGIMDPPYDGAYGMNAFLGGLAGIGGGVLLAANVEVSRTRMAIVDLGAAVGALAPWLLVYPLVHKEDRPSGAPPSDETNDDTQITSAVSLVMMGGGAGLTWYLTRHYDQKRDLAAERRLSTTPPGLLMRDAEGGWHLGSPALRLGLGLGDERRTLAVDLLSGTF